MTSDKKLKDEVRERAKKTGERYTAARRHVVGDRDEGPPPEGPPPGPPASTIARMIAAVERQSRDELAADPFLARTIERLDPDGDDATALLHARASVLYSGAASPAADSAIADWQPALTALLSVEPPAALLRLDRHAHAPRLFGATSATRPRPASIAYLALAEEVERARSIACPAAAPPDARNALLLPPPVTDVVDLGRADQLVCITLGPAFHVVEDDAIMSDHLFRSATATAEQRAAEAERWRKQRDEDARTFPLLIPMRPEDARDPSRWADLFECSRPLHGRLPDHETARRVQRRLAHVGSGSEFEDASSKGAHRYLTGCAIEVGPVPVPATTWSTADLQLGLVWLALRKALSGDAVRLASGDVILPLGAGMAAQIVVHRGPTREEVRASMDTEPARNGERPWEVSRLDSAASLRMPIALHATGRGFRIHVVFIRSPLTA